MDTTMLDIIVCDDHPVVRQGLARIIQSGLDLAQIREADNGSMLLDMLREHTSDLVLLDVTLPGRSGLEVLRQLKQERPRMPVLVLSVHPAEQYALRALRAGASGYLTKDLAAEELVRAVQLVTRGQRYLTPAVAERLADALDKPVGRSPHEELSDREFQVLCLIGSGRKVKQIADELCLSYNTISTYRSRVLIKLGLDGDAQLVRYALEYGLAD
jgi:two-component system, NarL family, invasion response regulator UvrY